LVVAPRPVVVFGRAAVPVCPVVPLGRFVVFVRPVVAGWVVVECEGVEL
jgi:hypothetical protein